MESSRGVADGRTECGRTERVVGERQVTTRAVVTAEQQRHEDRDGGNRGGDFTHNGMPVKAVSFTSGTGQLIEGFPWLGRVGSPACLVATSSIGLVPDTFSSPTVMVTSAVERPTEGPSARGLRTSCSAR